MGGVPVLVVDDDHQMRDAVVFMLDAYGFEGLQAAHGEDALRILRNRPDVRVIVLDLEMPVMDGPAFRRVQLGDPDLAAIPVIVLSAHPDRSRLGQSLAVDASFCKSVAPETLITFITALAGARASYQAPARYDS